MIGVIKSKLKPYYILQIQLQKLFKQEQFIYILSEDL